MGLIITTDDRGTKIYRKDKQTRSGGTFATYSTSISSKKQDGSWVTTYKDCLFKKGVELNNKAVIKIKNAFPIVDEYNDKKYDKIFVMDFEVIDQGEAPADPNAFVSLDAGNEDFMQINDAEFDSLPFK